MKAPMLPWQPRFRLPLTIGLISALLISAMASAEAAQALIPVPYPAAVPGAAPLDPEPGGLGGPQQIIRDPYPQILGENAQGNPPIARPQRHQHLIPTINQRKYRVDRLPRYYD